MIKPDENDPLKVRRFLALWAGVYALLIWPNLLVLYFHIFGTPESLIDKMLLYIGTLASGPIGAYIWAAHKMDKAND
jgi:hypothetical protein